MFAPRQTIRIALALLAMTLGAPAVGQATTYYVRKSGNDANTGTAAAQAFRTIDKARQVMVKGDICWVGAGTYEETVKPNKKGTAAQPIKFIGDTTGAKTGDSGPVILASKSDWVIEANGADYNEFHYFTLQKASGFALLPAGALVMNTTGFAMVNCTIRNVLVGLTLEESDVFVTDCEIDDILITPVLAYRNNLTMTRTTIRDCGAYAAYHFALSPTDDLLKFVDCTIENNYAGPYCSKTKLHLENTTLVNNEEWGAILVDSGLTLVNMSGNSITGNGGGLYFSKSGAPDLSSGIDATDSLPDDYTVEGLHIANNASYGIYASNCIVRLIDTTIENHGSYAVALERAELRGGAGVVIRNNANGVIGWTEKNKRKVKVENVKISGNTEYGVVHYGEASLNELLEIKDCSIYDNGSWACYSEKGNVRISNSQLERNGSGVRVWRPTSSTHKGSCTISGSLIDDILVSDAVYAHYTALEVSDSTISDGIGYGIQALYADVTIEDSTIRNVGQDEGYAIYHHDEGPVSAGSPVLTLRNSSILDNYGGPYANKTHINLDNVVLAGNRFWALVVHYGNVTWTGANANIVQNNGYGLYVVGNDPGQATRHLQQWQFVDNGDYGVYAADCALVLENCVVERMTGWGMGLENASFQAINTPIQNNGKGIAIIIQAPNPSPVLVDVTVTNNAGEGISLESAPETPGGLTLQNCTITNNGGWGLLAYHGTVNMSATLFDDNQQGLYLERDPQFAGQGTHVMNGVTVRDVASGDGVYVAGSSLEMTNCVVTLCAQSGITCYGENVTLAFCTISDCGTDAGYAVYHYHPPDDPAARGDTVLDHCSITHNHTGPYAHQTDLTVNQTEIHSNTLWGLISHGGDLIVDISQRTLTNNGYGMYVEGNPSADGRVLEGWNLSNNGSYGVYAVDCDLKLVNCIVEEMDQWGVGLVRSTLTTVNSPIQHNGHGIEIESSAGSLQPLLTDVVVTANTGIGIQHITDPASPGTLSLVNCHVTLNGGYALLSSDASLSVAGSVFDGNQRGIRLEKDAALDGQGSYIFTGSAIRNHAAEAALFAQYSPLTLSDCELFGNAGHGIECYFGDLHAENTTFSNNGGTTGYGIFHVDNGLDPDQWAVLYVQACSFTANGGGVYADHSHLTIDACTIENNHSWAVGSAYGHLTFVNQAAAINNNGSGLLIVGNAPSGNRQLTNFNLSNNGDYGLFARNCDLVLTNCQLQGMQGWALGLDDATLTIVSTPIINNGNGVHVFTSATSRDPQLTGLYVANTQGYGVYHESDSNAPGTLTMRSCLIENYGQYGVVNMYGRLDLTDVQLIGDPTTSDNGIYCYYAPQLTGERIRIQNHEFWGLLSYGSNVTLRNSIIAHNDSGAYLFNDPDANTSAALLHVTFAENRSYGVVQHEGESTIINSIIATNSAGAVGLQVDGGIANHSHNLFDGYDEACAGTVMTSDEVQGPARFVDVAAGDFRLVGSSTAINRGADLTGVVVADYAGAARPMFGKWDLGAYEYTSPSESAHIVEWTEIQ